MAGKFVAPEEGLDAFTCPHCDTLTTQTWDEIRVAGRPGSNQMKASLCYNCGRFAIWNWQVFGPPIQLPNVSGVPETMPNLQWVLVWPRKSSAPPANEDMPEDVRTDYDEAARILPMSPRAAAALLRLALQRLCIHLGQPGKKIDDDIKALVKEGLPPGIQQMMDVLRITGNEAVHPGEINVNDDQELALALFGFLNLVVEHMITNPKQIAAMWEKMPESKRDGVTQRDAG